MSTPDDPQRAGGSFGEPERAQLLAGLLERRGDEIRDGWVTLQSRGTAVSGTVSDPDDVSARADAMLEALRDAIASSGRVDDPSGPEFDALRRIVADISSRGVRAGATPAETAYRMLVLRESLSAVMRTEYQDDAPVLTQLLVTGGRVVDSLAVLTFETYVSGRETVISRQGRQLLEQSTPVVRVWDSIIALPLVGTLDSARAQVVMETLLNAIVEERALVAIVDITGVPTVDTLVAQHLLKTVAATRLMGAECIVSGIRPQTAQTIVQLGIDLTDVVTRATLADALVTAIDRVGATSGTANSSTERR